MTNDDIALAEDDRRPTLVCLHWLGGSGRSWAGLAEILEPSLRVVTIDLPGFGDAADHPGAPVAAMADHVVAALRRLGLGPWMLAGHSMGAKVALAVARRVEDGETDLGDLGRLVMLAGSPPAPEPMDDAKRQEMLGWFTSPADSRAEAQTLIDGNVGAPLDRDRNAGVAADILRLNRAAWVAWLDHGSREDLSDRIGLLRTPALIVAGEKDGDLGPEGQKRLMTRHFADVTFHTVPGAGHLLPIECPGAIARLILRHAGLPMPSTIPPAYRAFIDSDRVSARVRDLLTERGEAEDPDYRPQAMSPGQLADLRALVDRILPQPEPRIDIAARMDEGLATTPGDGWRFADLPPDPDSYRRGLETLQHLAQGPFASLDPARQDSLLAELPNQQDSDMPAATPDLLSPHQMALWFEDVRANVVRVYMSHPVAMARVGYSGIGYGGDGARLQGFATVGLGQTEPWEPTPMGAGR